MQTCNSSRLVQLWTATLVPSITRTPAKRASMVHVKEFCLPFPLPKRTFFKEFEIWVSHLWILPRHWWLVDETRTRQKIRFGMSLKEFKSYFGPMSFDLRQLHPWNAFCTLDCFFLQLDFWEGNFSLKIWSAFIASYNDSFSKLRINQFNRAWSKDTQFADGGY